LGVLIICLDCQKTFFPPLPATRKIEAEETDCATDKLGGNNRQLVEPIEEAIGGGQLDFEQSG
jgi:hypothetical protein